MDEDKDDQIDINDASTTDILSAVYEFKEISDFMEDETVDKALSSLVRALYSEGKVRHEAAPRLIIELQAFATKFAILATYYQTVGKKADPKATEKKNFYYTMRDAFTKLADNLKYAMK